MIAPLAAARIDESEEKEKGTQGPEQWSPYWSPIFS
jgi:hypothetical protein